MSIRISLVKSWLVFLLPLIMAQPAARTPDFVVYFVQGKVLKLNDPKHPQLAKKAPLFVSDMIALSPHAEIILVCKSNNYIKLDKPDTLRMSTLTARCRANNSSFIASYFHFIWDELTSQSTPNPQTYQHNIGAVSRGAEAALFTDTINYCSGSLPFSFGLNPDSLTVQAFNRPAGGMPLASLSIVANNFNLATLAAKLGKPGVYYWTVSGPDPAQGARHYLKVWQKSAYSQAVDMLLRQVVKTTPAETAYMRGFILEKNSFLYEAKKQYRLASQLEPGNELYHTTYSRFL